MRSSFPVEVRASTRDHILFLQIQTLQLSLYSQPLWMNPLEFVVPWVPSLFPLYLAAQKALEQFYPEISHPPPPISAFPLHQLNLEPLPFAENPRPQSKPDTLQIFAIFQHWGNRPVSIDDLKIIVIGSASSHASSFNTLGYVSHQVLVICWLLSPLITSLPFCCL